MAVCMAKWLIASQPVPAMVSLRWGATPLSHLFHLPQLWKDMSTHSVNRDNCLENPVHKPGPLAPVTSASTTRPRCSKPVANTLYIATESQHLLSIPIIIRCMGLRSSEWEFVRAQERIKVGCLSYTTIIIVVCLSHRITVVFSGIKTQNSLNTNRVFWPLATTVSPPNIHNLNNYQIVWRCSEWWPAQWTR